MKTIISTLVHSVKVSYAFHLQEEDITLLNMIKYISIPIANLLKRLLLSPNFDFNFIVKINRYCSQALFVGSVRELMRIIGDREVKEFKEFWEFRENHFFRFFQ